MNIGCQGGVRNEGQLVSPRRAGRKVPLSHGNVGGSFGMKAAAYVSRIRAAAARRQELASVKWTADRFERFVSDFFSHGRDTEFVGDNGARPPREFYAVR